MNTDETDELAGRIDPSVLEHDAYATMVNHALRLERERNEARYEAESLRKFTKNYFYRFSWD